MRIIRAMKARSSNKTTGKAADKGPEIKDGAWNLSVSAKAKKQAEALQTPMRQRSVSGVVEALILDKAEALGIPTGTHQELVGVAK